MGWQDTLTAKSNGLHFKRHRKAFQNGLTVSKVSQYYPIEQEEARKLATRLLENDGDWMTVMQTLVYPPHPILTFLEVETDICYLAFRRVSLQESHMELKFQAKMIHT